MTFQLSNPIWACEQSLTHVRTNGQLLQVYMCSPYQLPSTYPTCDYQEGTPLAIYSPPCGFVTLSGQLFIHGPRLTRQHGWFHPGGTTHISDLVSHNKLYDWLRKWLFCPSPRKGKVSQKTLYYQRFHRSHNEIF